MDKVHSGPVGASIPGGSEDGGAASDPLAFELAVLRALPPHKPWERPDGDHAATKIGA